VSVLLLLLAFVYFLACLGLLLTWRRMPVFESKKPASVPMTVVIPCRNEAANLPLLLADLNAQTYPHFEVIVADDASTDGTAEVAGRFPANFRLIVLCLPDEPGSSPKKRALKAAIQRARGRLIVTTDGDCRVGPDWLGTFAQAHEATGARLLSGPVTFFATRRTTFEHLQTVEFASLVGSGAVTMALGRPSMCNGANLCYEKAAFEAVGGFTGNEHLASGDDEFLMHKIAAAFPGEVRFVKSERSVVRTAAHASLRSFYRQRRRWASKWRHYRDGRVTALAVLVFLLNLTPLAAGVGWLGGWVTGWVFLSVLFLKFSAEALFLAQLLRFFGHAGTIRWIPLTQLVYPFYVLFFGLAAQGRGYVWKGRRLR
jgi:cellulose synthase/poly-beta-1,6-N-acetylglucosamine synthase-like glycosyltransferase